MAHVGYSCVLWEIHPFCVSFRRMHRQQAQVVFVSEKGSVARVIRKKASVWIVAVAVVALLATGGLVSVAFYVGNLSEPPRQLGSMPQDPVVAKGLGSGDFEIDAVPLEETRDGNQGIFTRHEGDRTVGVVSKDELVALDITSETSEDYARPGFDSNGETGSGLDEPGGIAVVEDKAQGLVPGTGETSIPTPEPAGSGYPADGLQAGPGTGASASPAFTPTPKAPIGEVGETATQSEGQGEALKPDPGGEGEDAGDQAMLIPEKRVLKYPKLGSHLNQLVASVEEGQATAEKAAEGAAIHQGESVAVTIHLSGNADDVAQFLEDNGGDPRNVGEDYIEAYVPVILLGPISERPGVIRVREIIGPEVG